jgi:hypothetical protein
MVSSRLCCGDYAEVEDRVLGGDIFFVEFSKRLLRY